MRFVRSNFFMRRRRSEMGSDRGSSLIFHHNPCLRSLVKDQIPSKRSWLKGHEGRHEFVRKYVRLRLDLCMHNYFCLCVRRCWDGTMYHPGMLCCVWMGMGLRFGRLGSGRLPGRVPPFDPSCSDWKTKLSNTPPSPVRFLSPFLSLLWKEDCIRIEFMSNVWEPLERK